ncbi:MAG: HAMP domain-containing histidine kinase [Deltaproteobacteria bacterium]|nr:HAMP domain-containing histidine kinase [Deltaproteobacteria bacterium]
MCIKKLNPEDTGLVFFGRVSASVSHEIKNVLAIINENSGLLGDFVLMAEKGVPLSTERLGRLAGTVRRQIQRADGIIKKMNRFAHSVDRPMEPVDLYDAACLVTDICDRMISINRVTVNIIPPAGVVTVNTHRFYLQNMLWICIESIMKILNANATVQVRIEKMQNGAEIRFGFEAVPGKGEFLLPENASALMTYLEVEIGDVPESGEIRVCLPEEIRCN